MNSDSVYEYVAIVICSIIFWNNYPVNIYTGVANSSKGAQANGATVQFLDAFGTPVGSLTLNGSAVQRWPYVAYLPTGTPTTTPTATNTGTPSPTGSLTFGTTPSSTSTMSQTPTPSNTVRLVAVVLLDLKHTDFDLKHTDFPKHGAAVIPLLFHALS